MKNIRSILILISLLLITGQCFGQDLVIGARPTGMGGAFVGLSNDSNSIFTNPAGLAQLSRPEITSLSSSFMGIIDRKMIAGAAAAGRYVIGAGMITSQMSAGSLTGREESGGDVTITEGEEIYYYDNVYLISAATVLSDRLMIGASGKLFNRGFSGGLGDSASNFAMDIGLLFRSSDMLSVGARFENFHQDKLEWGSGYKEVLESSTSIGCAVKIPDRDAVICVDGVISHGDSNPVLLNTGAEYRISDKVCLRAGLEQSYQADGEKSGKVLSDICAGVGIEHSGFGFDYAYKNSAELAEASTHYFSITCRFK